MKRYLSFITISLFCFLIIASSCSGNENLPEKAKPGSYTIEKVLHIIEGESGSRGIKIGNDEFDTDYDPNYVYLHIVGSEDKAFLPIYTMNCDTEKECWGFSYHIKINEDGSAIVTPILSDGTLSNDVLTIDVNSACYFSSEPESVWQLDTTGQIFSKSDHILYKYKDKEYDMCDNNKEIYRSITNFSITDLANNYDDIIMERSCAAFSVFGLFYDGQELDNNPYTEDDIVLEEGEFERTMGSNLEEWYIKLYIGGQAFVPRYDIGTKSQPTEDILVEEENRDNRNNHKYYSTGIFSPEYENHNFQSLTSKRIGSGPYTYKGLGYYTPRQIRLLAPVIQKELNIYVLIKKWDNNNEEDFEQWLASDSNALYTKVDISGYTIPENNCFYTLGLLMDIRQFKEAWEAANNPSPASRTANGMHYFELKDAKVIVEKH